MSEPYHVRERSTFAECAGRRQVVVGNAIAAFFAPSFRLVIEVDGSHHRLHRTHSPKGVRDVIKPRPSSRDPAKRLAHDEHRDAQYRRRSASVRGPTDADVALSTLKGASGSD